MKLRINQHGSVLLECLIAILLFSIGILTVVALQAASTRMVTESQARLEAANIAKQIVGLMWAKKSNLNNFDTTACGGLIGFGSDCFKNTFKINGENKLDVPALPSGKISVDIDAALATIEITWLEPGKTTPHSYITRTYISD